MNNNGPGSMRGDQPAAFRAVTERIASGARQTKLVGFAGTGKSWVLARIAEWAKGQGWEVSIAAPTHKAAGVIQEKLGADIEVRTIHSLLGLRLEPDYEDDSGGRILKAADSKSKVKGGLVICDEASMLGSVLKEQIEQQHGVVWLFVGDLAQLPPVGESISELLDDPDATLETVLRQEAGSEILNLATRIRQGDLGMTFEVGKDVFRVADAEELFQAALSRFQQPEYQEDASYARMLVFRNDRRRAINWRMRKLLVGTEEPYAPGEWLVMYQAFSPEKSRLNVLAESAKQHPKGTRGSGRAWKQFFNYKESLGNNITQLHVSEEVRILSAGEGQVTVGQWDFDCWRLTVQARGDQEYELPVLQAQEVKRVETLKAEQAEAAHAARRERDGYPEGCSQWNDADGRRKRAWSIFFSLEETFAQVDYAYCMTTHRAQGSTFNHVFVDCCDLMSAGGMVQRILYTAVTRPSKSLTFYR